MPSFSRFRSVGEVAAPRVVRVLRRWLANQRPADPAPPPVCPAGQAWSFAQGKCVSTTPPTCPTGQHWDAAFGACVADAIPSCPPGRTYDPATRRCLVDAPPPPTCPAGQHYDEALKQCVNDPPPTCPAGQHWDAGVGDCVNDPPPTCQAGYHWDAVLKQCVADPPPTCPTGKHWDQAANGGAGACVDDPPPTCPVGQHWDATAKACVDDPPPSCPAGQHWDAAQKKCVADTPPVQTAVRPWGRFFFDEHGVLRDKYPGFDPSLAPGVQQPREYLDTTFPILTGTPFEASDETSFNAAYKAADAAGGGVILLAPGFDVWTITIPARTAGSNGWIVIQPKVLPQGFPSAGNRMDPLTGLQLPRMRGSGIGGSTAALTFKTGAHHVRVVGVRMQQGDNGDYLTTLVNIERDAHDITFDRIYITEFDKHTKTRRGIGTAGYRIAVIDSWIDGMKERATDAQGIGIFYGQGPFKVVGNYISGAAEPLIAGGSNPYQGSTPTYYPADLEFRRNHTRKPQEWNVKHPAARDYGDKVGGPLTIASVGSYTRTWTTTNADGTTTTNRSTYPTYTLQSGQVFDRQWLSPAASGTSGTPTAAPDNWRHYYMVALSGPGKGSWKQMAIMPPSGTAPETRTKGAGTSPTVGTGGRMENIEAYGNFGVGTVVEVRFYSRYMAKNLFELKNLKYALISENVFENSWEGDDSQPYAVTFKSVNQSFTESHVYHETSNIIAWDNVILNCYGGLSINQNPQKPAVPAHLFYFDNWLMIAGPGQFIGTSSLRSDIANVGVDHITLSRITGIGFRHAYINFNNGATAHETGGIDGLTVRQVLSGSGQYGWRCDNGCAVTLNAALASYDGNAFLTSPTGTSIGLPPTTGFVRATGAKVEDHLVNPVREDPWGSAADFAVKGTSPFASILRADGTRGPAGVDWPQLKQRTAGVRANVPHQWGV